jgi:hypothetical protein
VLQQFEPRIVGQYLEQIFQLRRLSIAQWFLIGSDEFDWAVVQELLGGIGHD